MLNLDIDAVITSYKNRNLTISPAAVAGLTDILDFMNGDPALDDSRWAAYMLATTKHECAQKWRPIEEFGKGKNRPYGQPVEVTDANGTTYTNTYYGRGYVQLTWKANYDRMSKALDEGNMLVLHPEHALEPQTAYKIMSMGMRSGMFTGKSLADYINGSVCDYVNARRIINRLDQAELIQTYAREFEEILGTGAS